MLVEGLRVLRLLLVVPEDAKEVRGGGETLGPFGSG